MTIAACAELVHRGDPDRFLAAMAAPLGARETLFVLYAFNLEVARAPWVSNEPAIAQMRLQFWRDTLAEIDDGKPARAHEVAAPLADVMRRTGLPSAVLDDLVVARWADVARSAFATEEVLWDYLDATGGGLMWASMVALGADAGAEPAGRAVGRAMGLANWLMAVPALERLGWGAFAHDGYGPLIARALEDVRGVRGQRFGAATPALRAGWRARAILRRAQAHPDWIGQGALGGSEFARRGGLLRRTLTGGF